MSSRPAAWTSRFLILDRERAGRPGASLSGASIGISAQTDGLVVAAAGGAASVDFTESATVAISGASLTAASVGLSAQGRTQYSALGIAATNGVSGDTETTATTSTLTATAGGVSLSATDTVSAAAEASPQSLDLDTLRNSLSLAPALAWNNLNRSVQASVTGSTVSATGGT